jgi:hypothetical protein
MKLYIHEATKNDREGGGGIQSERLREISERVESMCYIL